MEMTGALGDWQSTCLNRDLFFVLCSLCPFMCLPVSRLFWVSSLAYPNLLGTKGYVVVVVVVVGISWKY
jgi:hypothetical protein